MKAETVRKPAGASSCSSVGKAGERPCQCSQQSIAEGPDMRASASHAGGSGALPRSVARMMEEHFGTSFADVRIHADEAAARDTSERGAAAYTKGAEVFFGRGQFQPLSASGQRLIAHEFAHVVQQRSGRAQGGASERASQTTQRLEDEADAAAAAFGRSPATLEMSRAPAGVEQFSLIGDLAEFRAALGSGVHSAARWVLAHAADDPLIARLGQLMSRLSAMRRIRLPRPLIMMMEDWVAWARSMVPSWFPFPSISFHGDGSQGVAVVDDVAIGTILLFIALVILVMWLMMRLNPTVRRAQDRAVEDMIDRIREGMRGPPRTIPRPVPETEPVPVPETEPIPVPETEPIPAPETEPVPVPRPRPVPIDPIPIPDTRPTPEPGPEPAPRPRPRPRPGEDPPPPLPRPRCEYPTGLIETDPIPIRWHKLPVLYPSPLTIGGHDYYRDREQNLPHGEPLGVSPRFWPRIGKVVQLVPDRRGTGAADFRAVLESYGYTFGARRHLQADHVQDLQWARPDGENLDQFRNLWPYDGAGNASAGATQNVWQRVSYCETPAGPAIRNVPIQTLKRPGGYGRYFIITSMGLPV